MKNAFILLAISVFLFTATVFAEISIKAEVDKTNITADETLTYKIIVTSSEKKLPVPQSPKFSGFNIVSQAHSSTISFVKSEIKTILVYAFILAPTDIGKFQIEPSSIKIKGRTYSTQAFQIEVLGKPSQPQESPSEESVQPQVSL